MKKRLIILIILPFLAGCLKDDLFKNEYKGFVPVQGVDDWAISSPQDENIDPASLEKAFRLVYDDDRFTMARSLLVFRNKKLVAEAYPHDRNDLFVPRNIQSCTKSVTSLLVGMAIHDGLIQSPDERLFDVYPEYFDSDTLKRSLTLEDALTMRTGLEFDNRKHTLTLYQSEENSLEYVLSQKRLYDPGEVMNYNDGAPQLVSGLIEKKAGKTLAEYARERLMERLGIRDWKWESAKDGTTFGAFSLFLKPRDFGKIGQLLLQEGNWLGNRIIDSNYLELAVSTQVSANFSSEPYGYYFWILPSFGGYCAQGHGGQFLLIVPSKDLVAVYTAWPYTSGEFFDQRNELMELIINSCK